jgi:hypothetical protein
MGAPMDNASTFVVVTLEAERLRQSLLRDLEGDEAVLRAHAGRGSPRPSAMAKRVSGSARRHGRETCSAGWWNRSRRSFPLSSASVPR